MFVNECIKASWFCLLIGFGFYSTAQSQPDPNGFNTFYYSNGIKSSEGNLEGGKPNGYWITYYQNGNKKTEGNRLDFQLDSLWKFYGDSGRIENEISYKHDKKNGLSRSFNTQGNVISEVNYKNNQKNGIERHYYESGKLKQEITYDQGRIDGIALEFSEEGLVITNEEYSSGFLKNREEINRYDIDGQKTGVWKEYYDNGKEKWVGSFKGGKVEGIVREFDSKGRLLKLDKFQNGIIQEDAEEVVFIELHREYYPTGELHFIGGISKGKRQGLLREFSKEGDVISSYIYQNDTLLAKGMTDSSSLLEGDWIYYYPNGKIQAQGKYKKSVKIGEWKYFHTNSKIEQIGAYKNGLPEGEWNWYFKNEKLKRKEFYRKGKEDGESIELDSSGNIITKGEFIDGIQDGNWYYNVGDHTETGLYADGEKTGIWEFHYIEEEGNKVLAFKGEYINGIAIGKHRHYYPSGRLKEEGKYESGMKEGEWKKFNENGEVILTILYKNGVEFKLDGVKFKPGLDALD